MTRFVSFAYSLAVLVIAGPMLLLATPASAEMEYKMEVLNNATVSNPDIKEVLMDVSVQEKGCADLVNDGRQFSLRMGAKDLFSFWRSKSCSGKQGQFRIGIMPLYRMQTGSIGGSDGWWHVWFDFSNSGGVSYQTPTNKITLWSCSPKQGGGFQPNVGACLDSNLTFCPQGNSCLGDRFILKVNW